MVDARRVKIRKLREDTTASFPFLASVMKMT